MGTVFELIDRHDALEAIAALDQDRGIAGECAGVAGDAHHDGHLRGGKLPGLRFGAGARRVHHDGVETRQLRRQQRTAEQIARLRLHRPQARRAARGAIERGERGAVAVERMHLARLGETQRERTAAGEQVGDAPRRRAALQHEGRQDLLAARRRLQERAGRRHHLRPAHGDHRQAALDHDVAVHGQSGEVERRGGLGQAQAGARIDGPVSAQVDVEAGSGRRHLQVERLSGPLEQARQGERGARRLGESGLRDRADGDLDEVVAPRRHVADPDAAILEAGVKRHPPPSRPVRIDERLDGSGQTRLAQRLVEDAALPGGVGGRAHMLSEAAAAAAEIGAERLDPVRRRRFHRDEPGPRARALDEHRLVRQRVGHEDGPVRGLGDAVAATAEARDGDALSHGARRSGIRGCRRRRGWARRSARGWRSRARAEQPRRHRTPPAAPSRRARRPCRHARAPPRIAA